MPTHEIAGPYFEDFVVGQTFSAPSMTLTDGQAALYQALTGDRMRLPLDRHLARRVTGSDAALAHPNLVTNVAIGQTTYASQHVKGNLFYRGLVLRRPVFIGESIHTTTRVVGLKQNRSKAGRAATGLVALEMDVVNQDGEQILHFWRCPMIPCRAPDADTGHDDDFSGISATIDSNELLAAIPHGWNIEALQTGAGAGPVRNYAVADECVIEGRDTVTCAPELVRMTGNIAFTHTDAQRSYLGRRLVYGGHTVSLALAQVTRALPDMITVVGWQGCDHLGPVLEEDIIRSRFVVVSKIPVPAGGNLYALRVASHALRPDVEQAEPREEPVLDWRLVVWSL